MLSTAFESGQEEGGYLSGARLEASLSLLAGGELGKTTNKVGSRTTHARRRRHSFVSLQRTGFVWRSHRLICFRRGSARAGSWLAPYDLNGPNDVCAARPQPQPRPQPDYTQLQPPPQHHDLYAELSHTTHQLAHALSFLART